MALIKEKHKVKKNNKVKPVNQPVEQRRQQNQDCRAQTANGSSHENHTTISVPTTTIKAESTTNLVKVLLPERFGTTCM
jgi:hypothetical protein